MTTLHYARTADQRRGDHAAARQFEEEVGAWLGTHRIPNLDSKDRMDWWVPGVYIDVKEKRQPISKVWPLPPGSPPEECFILDELSVRRAMEKFPHAYFVVRDVPGGNRIFLMRIDEVVCADRVRVNRVGSTNVHKGKWVLDFRQFRQLSNPAEELLPAVLADQVSIPWKQSACLVPTGEL